MATAVEDALPVELLADPFKFLALCWPHINIYDKQAEIVRSVERNKITVVPAANMMGKDFSAAYIMLWYFLSHTPCRILTTSAKADHLEVLWGETRNFVRTSKYPLLIEDGGPLRMLKEEITRPGFEIDYVKSMVANEQTVAAMGGHHAKYTLFVVDEASGVPDSYWEVVQGWMKKALIIGNTWPCENFFKHAIKGKPGSKDKGGDIPSPSGDGSYYRKIIRIKAEDSPNVRLALTEKAKGKPLSNRVLIPGVKTFAEYTENRLLWDDHHQCVALDAEFYEGAEIKLYPPDWLNRAGTIAASIQQQDRKNLLRSMGIDPAEGGDCTVWTIIDNLGILLQRSMKTPDTSIIPNITLGLMKEYNVAAERVMFDAGGGGSIHADALRAKGINVSAIGFGEQPSDPLNYKRYHEYAKSSADRREERETKYVYKNRRAEMYGLLRMLLNPALTPQGFGIPAEYTELRRQLAPLPLWYDEEGRMYLPPKNRKPDATTLTKKVTINDLIGCSPDEADSLVLAVFGLLVIPSRVTLGAMF